MEDFADIYLESSRLVLKRCHYKRDANEINAVVLDTIDSLETFLPWATGNPTVQDTQDGLKRVASAENNFAFRIYLKSCSKLIGMIGLYFCNDTYEVGYWCHKEYTCKGIMTEALKTLIDFAKKELNISKLKLLTKISNTASRNLAEKFGFEKTGEELEQSLLRPEWGEYRVIVYEKKL